jgi:preprotein translocase subunit SecG
MSRKRTAAVALSVVISTLAFAPSALAVTHGGEGIWGPTNDKTITNAMFIIMGLFVVLVLVFSLLQSWLEHRKHARVDATLRREASEQWKGGW